MAIVNFYQSVDMLNPQIFYGSVTSATSRSITIADGIGNSGTYSGSFYYSGGYLAGGTVNGYTAYRNYILSSTVSNVSIDALTLNGYLNSNNALGLYQAVLNTEDTIIGSPVNDYLKSWGGNDVLYGGQGSDYMDAGSGNDTLDGGLGVDTVVLSGSRSGYFISSDGHSITDRNLSNIDMLINVERLHFTDVSIALDVGRGETAGEVYRIYKAVFGRKADDSGLGYYIHQIDNGMSLKAVANDFISSAEFTARYGANASDETFIRLLYNNVLGRDPDQGGFNYYMNQLSHGIGRTAVLIDFSESVENVNNIATQLQRGDDYGDAFRLYKAAFNRTPDQGGLDYYTHQLQSGISLQRVANDFIGSAEFQTKYGAGSSNETFVNLLYNNVLGRAPDQGGYDYYLNQLNNGMSRADALLSFSGSAENVSNSINLIGVGVHFQEWG